MSATVQEGGCGLNSHRVVCWHNGCYQIQPNLLNGHKPRLSDGANNIIVKNEKSDKCTIYIVNI